MPGTVSRTPKIDEAGLDAAVARIAEAAAPAALGVGLMNLESGQVYAFEGERHFPTQSVFKLALGAAALSEAEAGRLSLDEPFQLSEEQLSPPHSPIAAAWPGRRDYSAAELLAAAVTDSDNTAADVLMRRIGGPGALTAWLKSKHVHGVRVDRYERELQPQVYGMASFRPTWRTGEAFAAARDAIPPEARMAAMRAYMADPRDTATPRGMLSFLLALQRGELLGPDQTARLLALASQPTRAGARIRAGLPPDAKLAHKPGTSGSDQGLTPAHNDVGLFTLADGRVYALAVFLSGSTLEEAARDRLIAQVTAAAVRAVG